MNPSQQDSHSNSVEETAEQHARHCHSLLTNDQLAEAISYCNSQGVESPQCSLTAQSINAHKLREKAKDLLSDTSWWAKRLKLKQLRDFEQQQRLLGKVTQGISDAAIELMKKT